MRPLINPEHRPLQPAVRARSLTGMVRSSEGISFTAIVAAAVIPVVAVVGSIVAGIVLVFA